MGAVPKKKVSRRRRGNRRSHWKIKLPSLGKCPNCHELKLNHHVCLHCGQYNGRQVLELEKAEAH